MPIRRLVLMVVLVASLGQLAGCASGPQSGQAAKWITEDEAAKKRLNDAGFPQYVGAS